MGSTRLGAAAARCPVPLWGNDSEPADDFSFTCCGVARPPFGTSAVMLVGDVAVDGSVWSFIFRVESAVALTSMKETTTIWDRILGVCPDNKLESHNADG